MNFSGATANEPSLSKCDPSEELATADLVTKAKYFKLKRRFSALKEVRRSASIANQEELPFIITGLKAARTFQCKLGYPSPTPPSHFLHNF